jgi:hypothetical protein
LFELTDEELHKRSTKWLVADADPGYPCRVSLADAEVGERVLATTFIHHDVQSPYRASGPVFVREIAQTANLVVNEIPIMFHHRLLSLRAYDSHGMMVGASVIQGNELEQAIVGHFENRDVEYQHIHNANPGCFNCSVQRA